MSWNDRFAGWLGRGHRDEEQRHRQSHPRELAREQTRQQTTENDVNRRSLSPTSRSRTVEGAWHGEDNSAPGHLRYGIGYGARSRLEAHDSTVGFRPEDRNSTMDATSSRGQQNYRGIGPKGYRRTDEQIHDEVCELLAISPSVDATEIEVSVKNAKVVLTGSVPTRNQKRMAEDIAESIRGVHDVYNRLDVPNLHS